MAAPASQAEVPPARRGVGTPLLSATCLPLLSAPPPSPWPAMPVSGGAHVYPAAPRRLHRVQRRCTPPLPRPADPRPNPSPTPNLSPNPPTNLALALALTLTLTSRRRRCPHPNPTLTSTPRWPLHPLTVPGPCAGYLLNLALALAVTLTLAVTITLCSPRAGNLLSDEAVCEVVRRASVSRRRWVGLD